MTVEAAFGDILKRLRKERGLSQMEIVRRTGLDRTTVPKYEKGVRSPNLKTILLIAEALDVSPGQLVQDAVNLMKSK